MDKTEGFFPERELLAYRRSQSPADRAVRGEQFLPLPPPVDLQTAAAADNVALAAAAFGAVFIA